MIEHATYQDEMVILQRGTVSTSTTDGVLERPTRRRRSSAPGG